MRSKILNDEIPADSELRDLARTVTARSDRNDELTSRLQYLADLLADSGILPMAPILAWRDNEGTVRHVAIGPGLVVGRQPGKGGLALSDDELLSRRHFVAKVSGEKCELRDLDSHNGIAVNQPDNRVRRRVLHNGDLIFAGAHVLVFLDQRAEKENMD
jgi:hypothetical protein